MKHIEKVLVNEITNAGIDVLIAPPDREATKILEALSAELGIVLMKYFWETDSCEDFGSTNSISLNVFPAQQYMLLLHRLINYWNWERIVLVFSKNSCKLPYIRHFDSYICMHIIFLQFLIIYNIYVSFTIIHIWTQQLMLSLENE